MSVLISNDAELDTLLDAQEVEHICEVVLAAEGVEREVEISLSYVDEDEMHELNHEWRGIDRTTDVLSFECDSAFDEDIPADETLELGDIILAPEVIARQAPGFGNSPTDECRLMLVHGMLHLLGYDHIEDDEAEVMEAREDAILPRSGARARRGLQAGPRRPHHQPRPRLGAVYDSRIEQGPSVLLKVVLLRRGGFVTAVKTERNIKVMLVAGVCTVIAGCIVGLDIAEWATVIICCGLVIHGELCNTAMEAIVDLATQELHPLAKRAKDIAAASVYVLSITAAIVGLLVFAHALDFI